MVSARNRWPIAVRIRRLRDGGSLVRVPSKPTPYAARILGCRINRGILGSLTSSADETAVNQVKRNQCKQNLRQREIDPFGNDFYDIDPEQRRDSPHRNKEDRYLQGRQGKPSALVARGDDGPTRR